MSDTVMKPTYAALTRYLDPGPFCQSVMSVCLPMYHTCLSGASGFTRILLASPIDLSTPSIVSHLFEFFMRLEILLASLGPYSDKISPDWSKYKQKQTIDIFRSAKSP